MHSAIYLPLSFDSSYTLSMLGNYPKIEKRYIIISVNWAEMARLNMMLNKIELN